MISLPGANQHPSAAIYASRAKLYPAPNAGDTNASAAAPRNDAYIRLVPIVATQPICLIIA